MAHYRFLGTPRWLGLIALGAALVGVCVALGIWQHDRYEERATANDRIEAAAERDPRPISEIATAQSPPVDDDMWSMAEATGRYDPGGEILIRNRSVDSQHGYEVVTPLLLPDGTALLVDRGWVAASDLGASALPRVPSPPSGEVTVTGQVRASESAAGGVNVVDGVPQARRIDVEQIAQRLDYPVVAGAYVTDAEPPDGLTAIPVADQRERAWQNFAYAYQWWLFAVMVPVGLVVLARKEARGPATKRPDAVAPRRDEPVLR